MPLPGAVDKPMAFRGHRRDRRNCSTEQEPQPQPPCSPASQDPSPIVDGQTGLLPPGTEVEVRLDGKGYYGMWFEATVVKFTAAKGRNAPAGYTVTFNGNDRRRFASTHVRPRPPALESPTRFRPHDFVEACHERGWWPGLVLSADPRSVTVAFPITREVVTYMPDVVRPRRDYVDGDWVPSRGVVTVFVGPKRKLTKYKVGELVEVVRKRKMWIPARVAKVIDAFSYIVEYSSQNGEEGGGSEYLHWQFIRPAVQDLPLKNEFHRRTSAKRQANFKQERLASGKRAKSHVRVPFNGSPLYGHSTNHKIAVSDNVQNQLDIKRPLLRKVYSSKKIKLSMKKEGFEGPHSQHGPLELSSTGQKMGVNEIAGSQREPSLVMERSESTQPKLDSTMENAVNPNGVKYQEPAGVVPLSFATTSDGIDVLKELPQQPHFLPLQQYPETIQKGMKLGLKVAFNDFAGSIRKSSITDDEASFQEKKNTLAELKKNGFDVEHLEGLLDKLIEAKDENDKHLEEKSAVQAEKQQIESSFEQKDLLLSKIENDIGELEKKLGLLRQEAHLIVKEQEHDEEKLSRLKEVERDIEEALDEDLLKFDAILAEGQQKRLP